MLENETEDKQRKDKQRLTTLAVHALFVGIIFVLPEALLRVAIPNRTLEITWPMYAKSLITIAVFYINYFLIIPRTITETTPARWKFIGINLFLVTACSVLIWIIYTYLFHGPRGPMRDAAVHLPLAAISYIFRDAIMLILAVSLAVALRVSRQWINLEQRHQKLTAIRQQAELDSLRSQLNPHLLFNTLNSIYALIAVSPERAQKAIHELSSLLRYVVYENPRTVNVDHEIKFVNNFVELMRIRHANRPIELTVNRDDDSASEVAPLILINIIGNAFKHGNTSDESHPIIVNIDSSRDQLKCTTINHFEKKEGNEAKPGVGMSIMRRRIELIYGDNATLTTERQDGVFTACLSINFN